MSSLARPLFQVDPGWLFVFAGVAACAAAVLIPAQQDLGKLQSQLAMMKAEEAQAVDSLEAHAQFLDSLERGEPELTRRLAASQLRLVPKGESPVLLTLQNPAPITDWLESTTPFHLPQQDPQPPSLLSRLADGPHRLWLLAGGAFAVFLGLLVSPEFKLRTKRSTTATWIEVKEGAADSEDVLVHGNSARLPEGTSLEEAAI
ncbi:MAG TPA: hypothetical protein VG711_09940 [Phycisphaerales bacterium]|nr:hypothetical protein [Phycisphaerales bacterium]